MFYITFVNLMFQCFIDILRLFKKVYLYKLSVSFKELIIVNLLIIYRKILLSIFNLYNNEVTMNEMLLRVFLNCISGKSLLKVMN